MPLSKEDDENNVPEESSKKTIPKEYTIHNPSTNILNGTSPSRGSSNLKKTSKQIPTKSVFQSKHPTTDIPANSHFQLAPKHMSADPEQTPLFG